ncbi:MAG: hypothetical protein OQJ80_09740 [Kangiella sp.]|nr:hypothetical protein [Kangiella sp.]
MKKLLLFCFIVLIAGCSTKKEDVVYEVGPEFFSSGTTVKDVLIGLYLKVPPAKIGIKRAQLISLLETSDGKVIANNNFVIIAEFPTVGTILEDDYSYCHIAYGFKLDVYMHGPKVIGDCSNVKITGSRVKRN